MKYIFLILLFASCSHKTAPTVIFEPSIKHPKMGKLTDTVWVQKPLEVRSGWKNDTVSLIAGYRTKGYAYKVAIMNDTLRIVDTVPPKKDITWHEDSVWMSELHGNYIDDSGNVTKIYHFIKRRDTIFMVKPENKKFFDGAKYIVIEGKCYQFKGTMK